MRVARNDHVEAGRNWIHIQLSEIVNDVNANLADVEDLCFTQRNGPSAIVVVAAYGGNGSELGKLLNYPGVADIARVNDEVAAAKDIQRLGAEHSMRVGDQSDAEPMTRHYFSDLWNSMT